jgi:DNA primase
MLCQRGTALTPDQIRLINRLTKNITVLFDGDAADRAAIRGIDLILEEGMNVKYVHFLMVKIRIVLLKKHLMMI